MISQQLAKPFCVKADDEGIMEYCNSKEEAAAAIEICGLCYMKQAALGNKAFNHIIEKSLA